MLQPELGSNCQLKLDRKEQIIRYMIIYTVIDVLMQKNKFYSDMSWELYKKYASMPEYVKPDSVYNYICIYIYRSDPNARAY